MMKVNRVVLSIVLFIALISLFSGVQAEQKGTPYFGRTDQSKYRMVNYSSGNIFEMTLLDSKIMKTNILYMKRGILPKRTGIGEHTHTNIEEMYFVFNAPAEFTVDGHTSLLPANLSVLCPLGSSHALYNNSDETLQYLRIAVSKEKDQGDISIKYGPVPRMADLQGSAKNNNKTSKRFVLESPSLFRWAQFDKSLTELVGPAH